MSSFVLFFEKQGAPSGAEAFDHLAVGLQRSGLGREALEGLRDVGGLDVLVVAAACGVETIGHGGDDAIVDKLLDPTGIAKLGLFHLQRLVDGLAQFVLGLVGQNIVLALEEVTGYLHELVAIVVVELVLEGEAAADSGVGTEHGLHLLGVASEDDEHIGVGPREDGEQRLDDAMTKVFLVALARAEAIGLVDEEHIAARLVEHHLHIVFGLADKLAYETGAIDGYEIALGEQSHGVIHLAELTGHGGLTCAGVAHEDGVVADTTLALQAPLAALLIEACLIGHRADAFFHLFQTYHRIEFADALLIERGGLGEAIEGDIVGAEREDLVVVGQRDDTLDVPGAHLLGNEATDIGYRPGVDGALLVALDDGLREAIQKGVVDIEMLVGELTIEDLHEIEGGIALLLDAAVGLEHLAQRRVELEQLVEFVAGAAEPEMILAVRHSDILHDAPHDDLTSSGQQIGYAGKAIYLAEDGAELLGELFVGILARGLVERGAVDRDKPVFEGDHLLKALQHIGGDVVVDGCDQQIVALTKGSGAEFFPDLVHEHHLAGLHHPLAELTHAGHFGHGLPVAVNGLHTGYEDMFQSAGINHPRFLAFDTQVTVEGEIDSHQ